MGQRSKQQKRSDSRYPFPAFTYIKKIEMYTFAEDKIQLRLANLRVFDGFSSFIWLRYLFLPPLIGLSYLPEHPPGPHKRSSKGSGRFVFHYLYFLLETNYLL